MSWWANKVAGQQPPREPIRQQPMYEQPYEVPNGPVRYEDLPRRNPATISKLQAPDIGLCPSCQSNNYLGGQPDTAGRSSNRCFDCGYPKIQFGSGMGTGGAMEGTGQKVAQGGHARQAASQLGGFHPEIIVDRTV